jgi:hypothetical protein
MQIHFGGHKLWPPIIINTLLLQNIKTKNRNNEKKYYHRGRSNNQQDLPDKGAKSYAGQGFG